MVRRDKGAESTMRELRIRPSKIAAGDAVPARDAPWWAKLGPGLITGAADDDPSGIATYTQAGAQLGYDARGLFWSPIR